MSARPDARVVTREEIVRALVALGLERGDCVIVHASLSSFGHVEGGADAVIDAVLDAAGPAGTVVFPTFTGRSVRDFRGRIDELVYTGIIPKTARGRDDFAKSFHPLYSICAKGPLAAELCTMNDRYIFPAAEHKFLHWMGERGGKVLLVGCGHESSSTVHLIEEFGELEYKVQDKPYWTLTVEEFRSMPAERQEELRALHNGTNLGYTTRARFNAIEKPLVRAGVIALGQVGAADLRLMKIADVVRVGLEEVKRNPWVLRTKVENRR